MKKKILVIGSAGYVGSVLIKNLKQKLDLNRYQILGVDTNWYSKNLEINEYNSYLPEIIYNDDCRNFNLKKLNIKPTVIIFLAAVSNDPMGSKFKNATNEINTKSCIKLANQAKAIGAKKFIFASSCSIYGASGNISRKEKDPIQPLTDYAISKVKAEEGLEKISDKNFQVISLRFATAAGYSPKLRLDLVFNDFVASATAKKFIKILSDGSAWRPLIHVDDMSKAMLWAVKEKQNPNFLPMNVGSGTDALFIALKAFGIGTGDEVITVSNTAIPTVAAIKNTGAEVKFVDIGKDFLIDVKKIKHAINSKTKVIIPVHLFGQTCAMDEILSLSKKYNLKVIEDCAQACGALYKGRKAGSMGDIGCFSFYPTKILGTYGDGGFLTTNNKKLYEKMHRFRFYGIDTLKKNKKWNNKYYSIDHGTNSRLDEVQAAILNVKLKYINSFIRKRRFIAKKYFKGLKGLDIEIPIINKNNFHVFHIFAVSHPKRELIIKKMRSKNINLGIHYPYPIHTMKAYKSFKHNNSSRLIETEKKAKIIFSLPIYPSIKNHEIKNIIQNITKIILKI